MEEKVLSINLPVQISELATAIIFGAVSILSFFIPFALGNPQWIVGVVVNAFLFSAAIFLPKKYYLPIVILPSLGVLVRGLVFGPLTPFLVYFLPFIWLGNIILVLVFKSLIRANKGYIIPSVVASIAKFIALFLIAKLYFDLHLVPKLFLQSMGVFQLLTALAGALISFMIWKIYLKKVKN
jgi:hypothetical protein